MSFQRRFALDHQDLLRTSESENGQSDGDAELGQKRKRGGGRVSEDRDFWKQYDLWFVKEVAVRGKDLASPRWRE